jgi:hypothetical protein
MNRLSKSMISSGLLCLLAACQSAPLSWIDGKPDQILPLHHYPVRVVSVDQQLYFSGPVQVTPGVHQVVLELPLATSSVAPQKTVTMTIAPCTKYMIAGKRESLVKPDFELVIMREQPVAGCSPEEELKKANPAMSLIETPAPQNKS